MEIKIIDRDIKLSFDLNNNSYGTDLKGNFFELITTTQKIKGSLDDYEFIQKWNKLHPYSYNKMDIAILFNNLKEIII